MEWRLLIPIAGSKTKLLQGHEDGWKIKRAMPGPISITCEEDRLSVSEFENSWQSRRMTRYRSSAIATSSESACLIRSSRAYACVKVQMVKMNFSWTLGAKSPYCVFHNGVPESATAI